MFGIIGDDGVVLSWITTYCEAGITERVTRIFESFNDAMTWLMAQGVRYDIYDINNGLVSLKVVYTGNVGHEDYIDISSAIVMKVTKKDEEP